MSETDSLLAMITAIEAAGSDVLTLTEGLEQEEFSCSRLTRHEARRLLLLAGQSLSRVPIRTRQEWQEVDWDGWAMALQRLDDTNNGGAMDMDTLWFSIRSLLPATLMWLRLYRKRSPELSA